MAFNTSNLSVAPLGAMPNNYIWDYSTSDNLSTVGGANYFGISAGNSPLRLGDIIRVTASNGNRLLCINSIDYVGDNVSCTVLAANVSAF